MTRKSHQRAQVFALSRPCIRCFSLALRFPAPESASRTFTAYRVAVGVCNVNRSPAGCVPLANWVIYCSADLLASVHCPCGFWSQRRWLPRFQTLCLSSRSVFVVCIVSILKKNLCRVKRNLYLFKIILYYFCNIL